jgi:radical SAM superfamily enzyme YgiQ (UPF0313 family)
MVVSDAQPVWRTPVASLRALVVWPPQVLSYFNAGHHTPLYSMAGYLRAQPEFASVEAVDWSVQAVTWKEVADRLHQGQFDLISIMNDFDGVDGFQRLVTYARELAPASRLITFGRLSGLKPEIFQSFDLDGIVGPGDYEAGVHAYAAMMTGGLSEAPGVFVRIDGKWNGPSRPGRWLPAQEWVLPDVREVPYGVYDWLYRDDQNKFCGIPNRRELVVPVARGCPVGCAFCEVPDVFGRADRRLEVDRVLAYIERCAPEAQAEYVSFYAPTFTLNRRWVIELCDRFLEQRNILPWKCATTVHHLDEELVGHMGRAGCIRISVGVETLDPGGSPALPRVKQKAEGDIERLASWCAGSGIELNCFVIVGLPGTSIAGAEATLARLRSIGARVRPTMYCPTERLAEGMTMAEIALYNRQIIRHELPAPEDRRAAYGLLFDEEPNKTKVFERIESRGADAGLTRPEEGLS